MMAKTTRGVSFFRFSFDVNRNLLAWSNDSDISYTYEGIESCV